MTSTATAFLYYRDTALNARGYFEQFDPFGTPVTLPKATFRQTQFGGSVGAPLRRDRTFLFAAYEKTPTRASNVVTIDGAAAAALGAAGFPVDTGLVPYDQDLGELIVRGDHYWKPAHNLSVRLHSADLMNGNYVPFGGLVAQSRGARADRLDWGIAASQTDVIGSAWVNEARLQVAHQDFSALPLDATGPAVTVLGVASVGRSELHPTDRRSWTVQLKDTITRAGRRHTFKAGIDAVTIDQDALLSYNFGGAYTFAALPPIPGLLPNGLDALQAFQSGLPALYVQGYGDGESPFDYGELSLFAQDDWQIGSRLTLKGGLRYQHQRFPDFDVTISSLAGTTLTYPFPLGGHHVSPRIAAAFDADGEGRTTLRGAYGLFFGAQLTALYGTTNVFGREDGTRLKVYPFPLSVSGWQLPGHVLPEGAFPLPRVTITVGPDCAHAARAPGIRRHHASARPDDHALRRRHVCPRAAPARRARVQPDRPGARSRTTAERRRRHRRDVQQRLAAHRLRRDVVSRPPAVGDAAVPRLERAARVVHVVERGGQRLALRRAGGRQRHGSQSFQSHRPADWIRS